ncbi:hypothetical protein CHELA1G11_12398 [Hyphomicrobiales bacterium]|nr:hypothetical protein CHELA1G2_11911 [Hyphomicrobiales bacterium]CAH1664564.1 hypothetical protein CHELA1G11_12398 [Hyphomicrobiales bacterium]
MTAVLTPNQSLASVLDIVQWKRWLSGGYPDVSRLQNTLEINFALFHSPICEYYSFRAARRNASG